MSVPLSASLVIAAFERASSRQNPTKAANTTDSSSKSVPLNGHHLSPLTPPQAASIKRSVHNVLAIADGAKIVTLMKNEANKAGPRNIISKVVRQFPSLFRSSAKAKLQKASRLWHNRYEYINHDGVNESRGACISITGGTHMGMKRVNLKARTGRGRKPRAWVTALHMDMLTEFDRLRKLGVKFNWRTLQTMTINLIQQSSSILYHKKMLGDRSNKRIIESINRRWIQSFMEPYRIVSRAHTGKRMLSPQKTELIHKKVAYHLGEVARAFRSGAWKEEDVENVDETHFVINMDNGTTLGFCREKEVKYTDVVSGGEGMTMVVRISGGPNARIEPVFMVFQNKSRSYPIRGVPDDQKGISYRSGPKGWMGSAIMPQWLEEKKVITRLPNGRKRILFVDNCSGHIPTAALKNACRNINTELKYFPPNATDLVQPADSFIIQKIKCAWNARWEKHKMDMIQKGSWSSSGRICNRGKKFFLNLAVLAVRDVNRQRDVDGLTYARKAMIRTGLALNMNGLWEERQLFPKLQEIVRKYRSHFDGAAVVA